MRNFILAIVFISTLALAGFAQIPTPTAKPAEDDEVVKISTNLIQVDVTVTDKNGKIITDLKPEDFEIFENGEKQDISNFSFIRNVKTATAAPANKNEAKNSVPLPTTELKPEQVRRTIALVVDDLSLSFESVHYVRRALTKFVNEQMQPGDLAAIIRTGAGAGALQQFTSDKRLLLAAIERIRWNPVGNGNVGAFAPIQSSPIDAAQQSDDASNQDDQTSINDGDDVQVNNDNFRESVFATGTLGAVSYIVRGMRDFPGRKSVMLLSDGFQIYSTDPNSSADAQRVLESLRRLVDLANRSSVVIYTMDARGLQTLGLTAEDNVGDLDSTQIEDKLTDRRNKFFDTQEGLIYLAQQTGGLAIYNNNDLGKGIERMLDDQSYYLIGYQPDAETFDPAKRRFNKLTVKVNRKGASVRYRSGFFGVTDEKIEKPVIAQTPAQRLGTALMSPFAASEISLRLNTLFGNDAKQGNFVRSLLHINASDLKFTDEADGKKKVIFDVLAISFGENGAIVDQISKTYTLDFKKEVYEKLIRDGFVYHFTFPVKTPGAYQYRVAVRDHTSEKVGSANQFIEVPNLKKGHLTLSGVVLENLTRAAWQKLVASGAAGAATTAQQETEGHDASDVMADTSLRRFKSGTVLRYGFEVYNARTDAAQKPNLTTQIKIFREGKLIYDGKNAPLELFGQTNYQRIKSSGAIALGSEMEAGEYVLQISVSDVANGKPKNAVQFVQFEIQ